MKNILLTIILFLSIIGTYAQTKPVQLLIGENDTTVIKYFDILKQQFMSNKYVITEKGTTNDGSLTLTFSTPTNEENKTNSLSIIALFSRVNKQEICIRQLVMGTDVSAYENLTFIKDTFKKIDENTWYMKMPSMPLFGVIARFTKEDKYYRIVYDFTDKNM